MVRGRILAGIMVAILLGVTSSFALPNLIVNGDFSSGLNGWQTSSPASNVFTSNSWMGYGSPSGDNSPCAVLFSDDNHPNPELHQVLNLPTNKQLTLRFDFTLITNELSWGDDFRAQINVGYPGGGGFNPIFSKGTGGGDWQTDQWGQRYYSMKGFTYDLTGWSGTQDFYLFYFALGYGPDQASSAMLLDNVQIVATPEPGTISLLALGLGLVAPMVWRRKKH